VFTKQEIDRLLAARTITEEYESDYAKRGQDAVEDFHRKLKQLNFASSQEFITWNDEMNRRCLVYSYKITGVCDDCKGLLVKQCVALGFWGKGIPSQCAQFVENGRRKFLDSTGTDYVSPKQGTYQVCYGYFYIEQQSFQQPYNNMQVLTCPKGHGYSIVKLNEPPFDWTWKR
jgi:hypothetical protein